MKPLHGRTAPDPTATVQSDIPDGQTLAEYRHERVKLIRANGKTRWYTRLVPR